MRGTFVRTLTELAEQDPRILLLTGDLGYTVLEPFTEKFPERFFNVGVAEQNLVGVATGLAEAGFIPFVYSITPFASLRSYEFIRNGPILHQFLVRIVGVGGGVEYGHNGISHYGLEDIGVMRIQPRIMVIAPADYQQASSALKVTWNLPGPIYYRLGKDDKTQIPGLDGKFSVGRAQFIGNGKDLLIIGTGSICREAVAASNSLASQGIHCTVMIVSMVSPAPVDDLVQTLSGFKHTLVVEAHYTVGGLGSLVSETIAEWSLSCKVLRCGIKTIQDGISGSQSYLQHLYRISQTALVDTALQLLRDHKDN